MRHPWAVTGDWGRLDGRDNALNAVRLGLALLVIVGHSWTIAYGTLPPVAAIHAYAVDGFFVLSGYLIAASRTRLDNGPYLWRRALRIYPGLWVCLTVTAFGIVPLTAWLRGQSYDWAEGVRYVAGNFTGWFTQKGIGGTLAGVPSPDLWNGSLWTLTFELGCYLGLAMVFTLTRSRAVVAASVVTACSALSLFGWDLMAANFWLQQSLRMVSFFAAGALLYLARRWVPSSGRIAAACGVWVVAMMSLGDAALCALAPLALGYVLLWLGVHLPVKACRRNDVSYGTYVYAFPVQQMLVVAGLPTVVGPPLFVLASVALTMPLAWASWLLVERPAMRLGLRRPKPSRQSDPASRPSETLSRVPQAGRPSGTYSLVLTRTRADRSWQPERAISPAGNPNHRPALPSEIVDDEPRTNAADTYHRGAGPAEYCSWALTSAALPFFVDVGDAVVVAVGGLEDLDAAIVRVADAERNRREQGCQQARNEDSELDVLVPLGAAAEGELADQQADGETDPREQ